MTYRVHKRWVLLRRSNNVQSTQTVSHVADRLDFSGERKFWIFAARILVKQVNQKQSCGCRRMRSLYLSFVKCTHYTGECSLNTSHTLSVFTRVFSFPSVLPAISLIRVTHSCDWSSNERRFTFVGWPLFKTLCLILRGYVYLRFRGNSTPMQSTARRHIFLV